MGTPSLHGVSEHCFEQETKQKLSVKLKKNVNKYVFLFIECVLKQGEGVARKLIQ